MAKFRHETQQYLTVAAVVAETSITNKKNDVIFIEETNRFYQWKEGSSLAQDLPYVIDQTSETANGRWVAQTIVQKYDVAAVALDDLNNGEGAYTDVTVTGVMTSKANQVIVKGTLPADLYVTDARVIAADTVRLVYENQTGDPTTGLAVDISVLEF